MPQDANRLIWIDMEMTGLKPDTRPHHRGRAGRHRHDAATRWREAPVCVVHQTDAVLDAMDSWNKGTHGRSGLIDKVKASTLDEADVEAAALAFLREHVPAEDLADVRQLDLPGPPLPRALDAGARGLLPLPQPRRVDAEGAGAPLEARADEGHSEGRQARGARRHPTSRSTSCATTASTS